jgi:hypothetical protein
VRPGGGAGPVGVGGAGGGALGANGAGGGGAAVSLGGLKGLSVGAAAVLGHPWLAGLDCGALLRMEPGEAGLMAPVRCSHLTPCRLPRWVIGLLCLEFPYGSSVCRTRLRRVGLSACRG